MKLKIEITYDLTPEMLEQWMHHGAFLALSAEEKKAFQEGHPVHVALNPEENGGWAGAGVHRLELSPCDHHPTFAPGYIVERPRGTIRSRCYYCGKQIRAQWRPI
jgi:hypothetical protein